MKTCRKINGKKIIKISDAHIPYQDNSALNAALNFVKDQKPDTIIIDEWIDFYTISSFDKDPLRKLDLQKDIDETVKWLKKLRKIAPKAEIVMVESNHDRRLMRYIRKNAEELSQLRALQIEQLLHLDELDIEYTTHYIYKNIMFKHGDTVRKHSAYAARGELEKEGISGISGHCFDDQTEILTRDGWKEGLFNLTKDDEVATLNKETGKLEWNNIEELHIYSDYKELYHIKSTNIDLMVTDGHGLYVEDYNGNWYDTTAKELYTKADTVKMYTAIKEEAGTFPIGDDELRFLIWIVADGSYDRGYIRFGFKKQRKINRLNMLLNRLGIKAHISVDSREVHRYTIYKDDAKDYIALIGQCKVLPKFIANLSERQMYIVLEEYIHTDGYKDPNYDSYQISSSKPEELDILQELFVKNGVQAKIKGNRIIANVDKNKQGVNTAKITKEHYDGKVWCVTVPNGTLVVRRNGKAVVTLNTHRLGQHYNTTRAGTRSWTEGGCVCEIQNVEYMNGRPNWQQGIVLVLDDKSLDEPQVIPIPIKEGKIVYGDKLIRGKNEE